MLRLITGRSGFGKTEWIYREIERRIRETDERIILLVPEQFSFETERALLDRLGPRQGMRVDAYSFTRLAENVFREVGGLSGERLTEGGKAVLMRRALSELQDKLGVFARASQDTAFLTMMLSAMTEWKQACISPDALHETAKKLSHPNLKAKAVESALIYGAYDALLSGTYLDPLDELTRLRDALRTHKLLNRETVFIDAFRSFTGQELAVIEELLIQCREVNVSLCLDSMDNRGLGLFYPVEETARQLKAMAKRNGIKVAPPEKLTAAHRFQNQDMSTLEACAYRHYSGTDLKEAPHIEVYSAADPYEEADIVAESIHRRVRVEGMEYGDFAVIARSTESYRGIIDAALEKYGIAYYMSKPVPIDAKPLFTLLFSVLTILAEGFHSDEVFRYLKTGLAGLSVEEIADLENYTLLWRKNGAAWKMEWADHPEGFRAEWRERDKEKLRELNCLRARVVDPLLQLKKRTEEGDALTLSKALYTFLIETNVDQALMAYEQHLADAGEHTAAQEQSRLWDILMGLLDQVARTAGTMLLSPRDYRELFRLVTASTDISFIPQTQDSVIVGNADTIRAVGCRCVYLLGANEGLFPLTETPAGLFSDYERRLLMDAGLPIFNTRERRAAEERLYAYAAMTAPSQRLTVTFSRISATGGAQQASSIVTEILRIFTGLQVIDREQRRQEAEGSVDWVEAPLPAFEWTARNWCEQREPFPALRAYFRRHPDFRDKVAAVGRAVDRTPASLEEPKTARRLFGEHLTLSATQMDAYHRCRYQYFLRYGLRARPRGSTEVNPMTFGNVVHFVLEHAVRDGRADPEAYAQRAEAHARDLVEQYVELNMGGREGKTSRFLYLMEKVIRTVRDLIEHIMKELRQSKFIPVDFELSIGADGEFPFPAVALPDGGTVAIRGEVDRVDLMEKDGKSYLRVVDYKTGGKDFSLAEVMDGLQVQMFLYLMCLAQNGRERYGEVIPAGVLYMPAKREQASLARSYTPEDVDKKQAQSFQMKGILLHDPVVLSGMEEQLSGRFIPVKAGRDGNISAPDHLAELSDFGRLFRQVKKIVTDMAEAVHAGALSAVPMQDACEWCDYRAVCRRESGDPERKPLDLKTQEILEELRKEEGEHGQAGESVDTGAEKRH